MLLGFNKHTFMSCCIVTGVKVAALLRSFEFLIHFGVDFGDACWMEFLESVEPLACSSRQTVAVLD
jgi:hypothetical protein